MQIDPDIIRAIAYCRIGGKRPDDSASFARAKHDPERAVDELREWGADNRWPRHKTMRAAMAAALGG